MGVLLAVVLAGAVAASSHDGGTHDRASGPSDRSRSAAPTVTAGDSPSTTAGGSGPSSTTTTTVGGASPDAAPVVVNPDIVPSAELPLTAEVSTTTGMADGQSVTVRVAAEPGSQIFVAEARLCAGGTVIRSDSDMRPSRTGHCISSPLSAVSDDFVSVESAPPYSSLDLTYRVGVGQQSYTTQDGARVTITCDREHPCTLAVKFQVPYGYGFRTYPIEYR